MHLGFSMIKSILFFLPDNPEMLKMLTMTVLAERALPVTSCDDVTTLTHSLIPGDSQLVFIGSRAQTGFEPVLLARLIKGVNPSTMVVLLATFPYDKREPLDDFVQIHPGFEEKLKALVARLAGSP
jgi:hypothetical protein